MIYLDTHVVVWLAAGNRDNLSQAACRAIDNNDLRISPIVKLELHYLFEAGKITLSPEKVIGGLDEAVGLTVCEEPFIKVIHEACKISWTRDPFDRIITAQAMIHKTPLVTKDAIINKHYPHAIWD
jgi:PIN domain nuclease of toxin-antitoxin system